ncbi:MAG: CRISPR-associated helicase Cas3', partial [Butyrivibrio sp.]|nr:CRISPR-associated helicase Cas3' [Butyrivibrio sp.]
YPVPTDFHSMLQTLTEDRSKKNALSSSEEWEQILEYVHENELLVKICKEDYLDINRMNHLTRMFFARMLFSCLVDADYTATASFEDSNYQENAAGLALNPQKRIEELQMYRVKAFANSKPTPMNRLRETVYQEAEQAKGLPGVYTMTAPTGTGKTLALVAFALAHAAANGHKRIFIVLPFLSIISQNAEIYRRIFGEDVVLEDDSQTEYTERTRLWSDRWSAPIIVTTSVRFFETLFRVRTTDVRRLHQVANAVIVFDEAQTLPLGVTDATMTVMRELSKNYNTTILFSTATQPNYSYRKYLSQLPFESTEIIQNVDALFKAYDQAKNTDVVFSTDNIWSFQNLVECFRDEKQVLLVFNTVKKATTMYRMVQRLKHGEVFYLSSALCPQHRLDMLRILKQKLQENSPVWLISTQCVEAGVDIDFPCGAREIAPYTSIVQTAGRINRNGMDKGKMLVFLLEENGKGYPGIDYKNESMIALSMAKKQAININSPEHVDEYYRLLFSCSSSGEEDKKEIRQSIEEENYEALSEAYHLIEQRNQDVVIVPYNGDLYNGIRQELENGNWCLTKGLMKAAQSITVSVRMKEETKNCCRQLRLKTRQGAELTNWYLLEDKTKYLPDLGFIQEQDNGPALFI